MIEPLTSGALLFDAIHRITRQAADFTTSLFAGPEQIQYWADRGALSQVEHCGCLLIFRRDRDFYHLYHVAAGNHQLSTALASHGGALDSSAVLTADLVGAPGNASAAAGIYQENGFSEYKSLLRMVRIVDPRLPSEPPDPEVAFAAETDAPAIGSFLEGLLDRFSDQIPEPEEIRAAAGRSNILIVRRGQALAGLLFFETKGLTSTLRYWYVSQSSRGQGIGARLIRAYFGLCRSAQRFLLWVANDNSESIGKYEHYGFRREGLIDRIMIRQGAVRGSVTEPRPLGSGNGTAGTED
jgi:ribosomal protein S18 acetylase RimI-like enzyme